MFLHDELAATLDTGPGQLATPDTIVWTPEIARVSAAWGETPQLETLTHWLEACLPENGSRVPFEERARALKLDRGAPPLITAPIDILWGNTDAEYPGAVRFQRDDEGDEAEDANEYVHLSDKEIGERLHEAWRVARQAGKGPERDYGDRRSSLSGMRGKIGLTRADDGSWHAARGAALNTWIAKREDDPKLPGEAGVESLCQRTLGRLGIPAAATLSRVFAGEQAVLSERSDRYLEPENRNARPHHQEEFCQACGWPSALKYDWGRREEPRWEAAYAILERCALNPDSAQAMLTRILAACWALGHTDLHRRNLGFLHTPPDEPFGVEVAPMYDVSSGIGVEKTVQFRMAIGIARQAAFHGIGPTQWLEHAKAAGQDPATVLAIVSHTLEDLPGALADARTIARQEDENRNQAAVDSRAEQLLAYVEKRRREWNGTLGRMRSIGARGLDDEANKLAKALTTLDRTHGDGEIEVVVSETGAITVVYVGKQDGERSEAGTASSTRVVAEALIYARRCRPEDLPALERTLEKGRLEKLSRARAQSQ